jgi:hypothetical protein
LARKPDGKKAGKNVITITAGDNKTLNLDKKTGFSEILITAFDTAKVTMQCADIRATLKGSGKCDVFTAGTSGGKSGGLNTATIFYLAYKCAGGDVVSHKRWP